MRRSRLRGLLASATRLIWLLVSTSTAQWIQVRGWFRLARARTWRCVRVTAGVKCGHTNPSRKQICSACLKRRPARKRPAHMAALDLSYEHYVEINGSETCGICKCPPNPTRRLDRDHDHTTGEPRGLLCWACNRQLRTWATVRWLLAAASYLTRHEERTHAADVG